KRDWSSDVCSSDLEEWSGFGQKVRPTYSQTMNTKGRWPANVILDEHTAAWVDEQSGVTTSPPVGSRTMTKPRKSGSMAGALNNPAEGMANGHGDSGGASRFFYVAKAPKRDRKSTRLNSSHVSISYAVFC